VGEKIYVTDGIVKTELSRSGAVGLMGQLEVRKGVVGRFVIWEVVRQRENAGSDCPYHKLVSECQWCQM
jgi:hypothetical protein